MKTQSIKRGDIYYAKLNPVVGSEQGDTRPVLVVQNNKGNKHSPTIVIVPISCNLNKNPLPTHVIIPYLSGLKSDSLALAEQIRTIDRSRIGEYIGRIGDDVQSKIDTALAIGIGIDIRHSPKGEMFVLTLCSRCEGDFRESGYVVVRKGWLSVKEDCDFCKVRQGISFGIFKSESGL
jgi:mRNA interferase MazF